MIFRNFDYVFNFLNKYQRHNIFFLNKKFLFHFYKLHFKYICYSMIQGILMKKMAKLKVLDLFCGCGGLSSGFEQAGYQIIGGIDFNQAAIDTFNYNFKDAKGVCCDLLDIGFEKIKECFGKISDVDVIIGGPPCQGFSAANRHQSGEDPRNKLFYEFV